MQNNIQKFNIAVIGAGFSGSLTALGLHNLGYEVLLIEKESHPRFTIGESSTPAADLILRNLAEEYNMPWLSDLSRYGSWQKTHPQITCGLKRGFSYFRHNKGQNFQTNSQHRNELLVAASVDNEHSDTNWYRSEVDAFFVSKVIESGITYWENTEVSELERKTDCWKIKANRHDNNLLFKTKWMIDATGSSAILGMLGVGVNANHFQTNTSAIYSHFRNVKLWGQELTDLDISQSDYPYKSDDSALHHLLDEGWLWMLKFDNGITSCGLNFNNRKVDLPNVEASKVWRKIISKYPSLNRLFQNAVLAEKPAKFISTKRLQHRSEKACGDGWAALPNTVGFVDPLHSTGIAHSLSGVEKILEAFKTAINNSGLIEKRLLEYEKAVFSELEFLDLLVDGCYRSMDSFELFHIYSMLYFTVAVNYEQKRIYGHFDISSDYFLSADDRQLFSIVENCYEGVQQLKRKRQISKKEINIYKEKVKNAIKPYNNAELLQPETHHIYRHTAASF